MKYFITLSMALSLSACANGQTANCPYRNLIGKNTYSAEVNAVQEAGKEVRLLYLDSFIGFSKNENRVNLTRDDNDEIVAVTCG